MYKGQLFKALQDIGNTKKRDIIELEELHTKGRGYVSYKNWNTAVHCDGPKIVATLISIEAMNEYFTPYKINGINN